MKSVDEHIESIGAHGEDCESHGWARHAPARPASSFLQKRTRGQDGTDCGYLFTSRPFDGFVRRRVVADILSKDRSA